MLAGGVYAIRHLDIDVFPDLTAPTVAVVTDAENMATEEVERLVTFPIETAVNGATHVRRVRSSSLSGASFVWVEFDWGTDIYKARQIVSEKLVALEGSLPQGITPILAPQSSVMGEILFVALEADSTDMMELRTLADWVIKPAILATGGVSQVTVMGGDYKQYQTLADPVLMNAYGVTLEEVAETAATMSLNSSGGVLRQYDNEYAVRGKARTHQTEELGQSLIKVSEEGVPITLNDVGEVRVGSAVKMGYASLNAHPAVLLTVSKQPNVNTLQVTRDILQTLAQLQPNLPEDIHLNTEVFRQADFIEASVHNVGRSLLEGAFFVIIILLLFLGSFRSTLISVVAIPLSLLGTVLVLYLTGQNINVMTLGGMCIAIGSLVDDAIIDVENVYRKLRRNHALPPEQRQSVFQAVYEGSTEIRASILNATFIIIVAFTPLFFLSGMEGRMLKPLGLAYIISLLMSLLVAMTVTPLLCKTLLGNERYLSRNQNEKWLSRNLSRLYGRSLDKALNHKKWTVGIAAVAFVAAVGVYFTLGHSFLPDFNEGSLTISAVSKPGLSLDLNNKIGNTLEEQLLSIDEVVCTSRRTGRGELDEHSQAVNSAEIEVKFALKDRSKDAFLEEVRHKLAEVPGVVTSVGQPLGHRIDHILSGTQAAVAIKVFGPDLSRLYALGNQIRAEIADVPGVVDLNVEQQTLTPQLQIRANRAMLARHGITVAQFNRFVNLAFSGAKVGDIYEGQRRFDLVVRLKPPYTESMEGISNALITTASGAKVPLGEVAEIVSTGGPCSVSRENVQRKLVVSCNVAGRDEQSVVDEIRQRISQNIVLGEDYRIAYGGQFESAQSASRTLTGVFIVALFIIFCLLYSEFRRVDLSALILVNLPLALIGGVFAIFFSSRVVSIPSIIGFITLFGIAIRNGILLVSEYERKRQKTGENGENLREIVKTGSVNRLNPILMTALTAALALIPLIINGDKSGNEIQSPMAMVVLGGLLTSTLLNIYVVPILYEAWEKRKRVRSGLSKTCVAGLIFACAGLGVVQAQNVDFTTDNYKEVLEYIHQNSPALQADRLQMQADVKGNHTDLVPSDPNFVFGYAFVGEGGRHRRVDFDASQSFDFPSVYLYKARTARWSDSAAVYAFAHRRALLMLEAENLCMEMIYINSLLRYSFEDRMRTAYELSNSTEVQLEKGQVSIMDRNKALMNLLQMKKNFADLKARQGEIAASLKRLTGGQEVSLTQDHFPKFLLPEDFETFFARITADNPFLLQAKSAASAAEQNLKANVAESFPSFTVGYKSEDAFTPQDVLHGFYIGMNVPLWANKNHVKQAKLEAQAAQSREQDAKNELRARLETLYRKVAELYPVVQEYRRNISALNNLPYLEEALKSGEFSLLFYIDELQYQFDVIDSYLQSERDLAQAWSELKWLSGWKE